MGNDLQAHRLKPALMLILLFIGSLIKASGALTPTLYPTANQISGLAMSGKTLYVTTEVANDSFFVVFGSDNEGNLSPIGPTHTSTGSGAYNPMGAMIASGGTLYGTGTQQGQNVAGCVFSVNTNGSGFTVLHTFGNGGGPGPEGGLVLSGNFLYGTTPAGGNGTNGSVFALGTDGSFTNLYSFGGGDGSNPQGALVRSGNTLYGTTSSGGSGNDGTVFALNTDGSGFTNLYSFHGSNGANPQAGLSLFANRLYGTTSAGGSNNNGTVFAINKDGTDFQRLHAFAGTNGHAPQCAPVLVGDKLYGIAPGSTADGCIFFSVNPGGTGFTVLASNFMSSVIGGLVPCANTTNTTLFGGGVATFASIPAAYGFTVPGTLASAIVTMTVALTHTNTLVISWPSPSTGFTLQQNSNVGTTNWTNVAQTPADNGTTMSVVVPASPGSKFYRLKN